MPSWSPKVAAGTHLLEPSSAACQGVPEQQTGSEEELGPEPRCSYMGAGNPSGFAFVPGTHPTRFKV